MKTYVDEDVPKKDEYMFCDFCQDEFPGGCEEHPMDLWEEVEGIVKVCPSKIKNAGRGVFNVSGKPIPVGVVFGPYKGKFVPVHGYDKSKESGYAWELMDSDKTHVIGYVDPGPDPEPNENWLSMINSANFRYDQNVVAVQYKSKIMYRVCKEIPHGVEFLTHYGEDYGRQLGIEPKVFKISPHKLSKHWQEDSRIFTCEHCGVGFAFKVGLENHLNTKTKSGIPYCSIRTKKEKHSDVDKAFKCDICNAGFTSRGNLALHHKSIHLKITHKCEQCSKSFNVLGNLERHIKTVHDTSNRFKCELCGQAYNIKSNLQRHIKMVHEKQQRFACSFCQQRFSEKSSLNKHVIGVHTKQYPHICQTCNKGFLRPCELNKHVQRAHLNPEP